MLTREGFPFWEGYCRPLSHSSGYMLHVVQFCPRLQLPQVFPGHSASGQVHAGQFPAHPSSPEVQGEQLCLADRREEGSCSEQGEEGRCRCGAPLNPWCSSAAADSADLYMYYLTAMAVGWATWQVRTHLNYNQMTTLSSILGLFKMTIAHISDFSSSLLALSFSKNTHSHVIWV